MIYEYIISGIPVAWTSHRGFGKKSFNPHYIQKQAAQWELKNQHGDRPLIDRAVRVDFFFQMPIPSSFSKKKREYFDAKSHPWRKAYHDKRPDATNLRKHAEDCLTGTVLLDDNIVVTGITEKYYSSEPKTIIKIEEI